MATKLWPFVVYASAAALTVAVMLVLSYVLGQRHDEPHTGTPYESGIVPEGRIQDRIASEFYLVAAFFVVFDVETVFLFAWVVAGRALAWAAFVELAIFVGLLGCALVYLWRAGALDWGRRTRMSERSLAATNGRPRGEVANV